MLELITILNKLFAVQSSPQVQSLTNELLKRVTDIVSEMASENIDLVDANFSINYLFRAGQVKTYLLNQENIKNFLKIVSEKAQDDEEFREFLVDKFQANGMLLEVRDRFRIEGLDEIIMQKWIRGERCNARLGEIYRSCR